MKNACLYIVSAYKLLPDCSLSFLGIRNFTGLAEALRYINKNRSRKLFYSVKTVVFK